MIEVGITKAIHTDRPTDNFLKNLQKRDIRTDGRIDRSTDTTSYRDTRTHLKKEKEIESNRQVGKTYGKRAKYTKILSIKNRDKNIETMSIFRETHNAVRHRIQNGCPSPLPSKC